MQEVEYGLTVHLALKGLCDGRLNPWQQIISCVTASTDFACLILEVKY